MLCRSNWGDRVIKTFLSTVEANVKVMASQELGFLNTIVEERYSKDILRLKPLRHQLGLGVAVWPSLGRPEQKKGDQARTVHVPSCTLVHAVSSSQ